MEIDLTKAMGLRLVVLAAPYRIPFFVEIALTKAKGLRRVRSVVVHLQFVHYGLVEIDLTKAMGLRRNSGQTLGISKTSSFVEIDLTKAMGLRR